MGFALWYFVVGLWAPMGRLSRLLRRTEDRRLDRGRSLTVFASLLGVPIDEAKSANALWFMEVLVLSSSGWGKGTRHYA